MSTHTVILLLPEFIATEYGKDIYHWVGKASDPSEAVRVARKSFLKSDGEGEEDVCNADELHVLVAGEGALSNVIWEDTLTTA